MKYINLLIRKVKHKSKDTIKRPLGNILQKRMKNLDVIFINFYHVTIKQYTQKFHISTGTGCLFLFFRILFELSHLKSLSTNIRQSHKKASEEN